MLSHNGVNAPTDQSEHSNDQNIFSIFTRASNGRDMNHYINKLNPYADSVVENIFINHLCIFTVKTTQQLSAIDLR